MAFPEGKGKMKSVVPGEGARKVCWDPLPRQRVSLLTPQTDGDLGSALGPQGAPGEKVAHSPGE